MSSTSPPASAVTSSSSPATFSSASITSCSRWPRLSVGWSSPVSASTRYADSSPASRRKRVFESEQSPQKNPARCRRTSSSDSAEMSVLRISAGGPPQKNGGGGGGDSRGWGGSIAATAGARGGAGAATAPTARPS